MSQKAYVRATKPALIVGSVKIDELPDHLLVRRAISFCFFLKEIDTPSTQSKCDLDCIFFKY